LLHHRGNAVEEEGLERVEDSALVHPALRRRQHRLEGSAQSLFLSKISVKSAKISVKFP